jgi:hypothetical protein
MNSAASYAVNTRDGVTYVIGSVPITDLANLLAKARDAFADECLAKMLGAVLAWGQPSQCEDLKLKVLNEQIDRLKDQRLASE